MINEANLHQRIRDVMQQKYDIWNTENIEEMLKSIVMELGDYIDDCYYLYEKDDLEIMYDLDMSIETELDEFLEVYYKDIPVYLNQCIYRADSTSYDDNIMDIWIKKIHLLYFEANKQYLYCRL